MDVIRRAVSLKEISDLLTARHLLLGSTVQDKVKLKVTRRIATTAIMSSADVACTAPEHVRPSRRMPLLRKDTLPARVAAAIWAVHPVVLIHPRTLQIRSLHRITSTVQATPSA